MPRAATAMSSAILDYLRDQADGADRRSEAPYVVGSGLMGLWKRIPDALADDLSASGIQRDSIITDASIRLAGGYGLTSQQWDAVIVDEDLPLAAIEVKVNISAVSKNVRNRLDEIVAMATNLARTFDGPERLPYKPCMAVVFVIAENHETTKPRPTLSTKNNFPPIPTRDPVSYLDSVGATLTNLVTDRLLDAACYLAVNAQTMAVREPLPELSFDSFTSRIISHIAQSAQRRENSGLSAANLGRVLAGSANVNEVIAGLTSTPEGLSAAEAAVIRERRRVVSALKQLALDPDVNETKMHTSIGTKYWIFGGQYVGIADRRTIVPLDQYDIPLICADGSLEIVELKGPEASLVRRHRSHWIVSDEVHEAVGQCLNYIRNLDELGAALRTQYVNELQMDFDFRRARGTVVIGHPGRSAPSGVSREQIDQTIRSYNGLSALSWNV